MPVLKPQPSTEAVIAELRYKTAEKRKRDDSSPNGSVTTNGKPNNTNNTDTSRASSTASYNQSTHAEAKRRRHNSSDSKTSSKNSLNSTMVESDGEEFIRPAATPLPADIYSKANNRTISNGTSPKKDGHLRTALASSYSSSARRSRSHQVCTFLPLTDGSAQQCVAS